MNTWYYGSEGQQNGPVTEMELRRMLAQRMLTQASLVWREGMIEWKAVADVPELQAPPVQTMQVMQAMDYHATYSVAAPSGLAIASMVCGIVSVLLCYVNALAAIPAIICGHMALKTIRDSPVPMGGRGMAIAGLVTGYLGLLLQVVVIMGVMFFFKSSVSSSSSFP